MNHFRERLPTVEVAKVPDDAFLLDVRELEEWRAGHAPRAAHIPLSELGARSEEVPTGEDVFVICRSGARSASVVAAFNEAGWKTSNVRGGMNAWAAEKRPMVSETGEEPYVA